MTINGSYRRKPVSRNIYGLKTLDPGFRRGDEFILGHSRESGKAKLNVHNPCAVIPTKVGIQKIRGVLKPLAPGFRQGDELEKMGFEIHTLESRLAGKTIGHLLHYFDSVDSTNRIALQLAREGAPEGTAVIADKQTAGRGRLQRVWQSPPGCNLYTSIILRPAVSLSEISQITLLAGVAVAETISSVCPEGVAIKWPNDILIRGRKVSGILAESMAVGESRAVIVGIGVNVNISKNHFDPAHRDTATSLLEETGQEQSREELAFLLFGRLEEWYNAFQKSGFEKVREAWLSRSEMIGRRVRVAFQDEVHEGIVQGLDHDGALLIADEQGDIRRITAGDATILTKNGY